MPGTLPQVQRPLGQGTSKCGERPSTPEAALAFDAFQEAKRLYKTILARYDDLVSLIGRLKADEAVGQAATNIESVKASYQDALARGA
jgi:hypothetical protein